MVGTYLTHNHHFQLSISASVATLVAVQLAILG